MTQTELQKIRDEHDGWVPVDLALPESDEYSEEFIVTDRFGYARCLIWDESKWWSEGYEVETIVLAWQPLPKPYQPK